MLQRCALIFSLIVFASPACADDSTGSKNKAVELIKYFNPIPKKSYLNESQDRVIRKKSFRDVDLPDSEAVANKEIGLFAMVDSAQIKDDGLIAALLSDPSVNGLSVLLTWRDLEPSEGKYDWGEVDRLLHLVGQAKKYLILRVSTCGLNEPGSRSDTPQWLFDQGVKSVSYKGADGKEHLIPIFWDPVYLAKWSNFVNDLGHHIDGDPNLHSVGITGGGMAGGTAVVPDQLVTKTEADLIEETLKKDHDMSQRQLVQHWKYVADLFPGAFKKTCLNFDIDPPTANRAGQDSLDEISDYLVYKYGERVYLTRQNVSDAKHGFDQYRVLLKFRSDTLTGYQLSPSLPAQELARLTKNALDDGISFAEIPASFFASNNEEVKKALAQLRFHLGYQLVSEHVSLPSDIKSGEPLKVSFTFLNRGSATPKSPNRQFDRDIASSFRVQLELRNATGQPVVRSLHTPNIPTTQWIAGKPVTWEQKLKMPKLQPGEYSVWMSLVDREDQRKLTILDAAGRDKDKPEDTIAVGKLQVVAN